MGETKVAYTTEPNLLARLLNVLEDKQWARLVFFLSAVIDGTGWGEVTITLKNGKMDEIRATMTEKVRQ